MPEQPIVPSELEAVLEESKALGFLGPGPIAEHVAHALAFSRVVGEAPARFIDLGSGGGIPGLVLATVWTASRGVLLDGSVRRAAFLEQALEDLGLHDRIEICASRAEEAGREPSRRGSADLVVSRSFGAPAIVAECAAPLLRDGGRLVVSEPPADPTVTVSARWDAGGLSVVGLRVADMIPGPPAFVVLEQIEACPDRYPRRVGIPAKRPLF